MKSRTMIRLSDWKAFCLALALLLLIGEADAQQSCVASAPIIPATGVPCYSFDVAGHEEACYSSAAAACDAYCGGKMEFPVAPYSRLNYCYLKASGPFAGACGTWELNTDRAVRFSRPVVRPSCPRGYQNKGMDKCIDKYTVSETEDANARGLLIDRDDSGNILSVTNRDTTAVLASFGDYDAFGRPGWYSDGVSQVFVSWPSGNSCLFSGLTANDWTTRFSWGDLDHVAGVVVPIPDNFLASYLFSYLDGDLSGVTAKTPISPWATTTVTQAWADGKLVSSNRVTVAIPAWVPVPFPVPSPSAALSPHTAAASVGADPFFQPKVKVTPSAVPGGPAQIEVLGPLSLLYPVFDYLGRQIARFYMSTAVTADNNALAVQCHNALLADYTKCEQAVDDKYRPVYGGQGPWPPEAGAEKGDCEASARERYAACVDQKALPGLRLPPPFGKPTAQKQCEDAAWKQYENDFHLCESGYPDQGYDFQQCVKRAQTKLAAAMALCKGK